MKKTWTKRLLLLAAVMAGVLLMMVPVSAKTYKNKWLNSKGYFVYYDKKGKQLKNTMAQAGGTKVYCFDSEGRQRVGWIKWGKYYYYFNVGNKEKGYRKRNTTVNGIRLDNKGHAVSNLEKARLLTKANSIVWKKTRPRYTVNEKLRSLFAWCRNLSWRNLPGDFYSGSDWDKHYASYGLDGGYGDCYVGGATFAYLACAAGAKNVYAESSGGHGWATVNGLFYDPNWSWATGNFDGYFACPAYLSGTGGRPAWATNRAYRKRVD